SRLDERITFARRPLDARPPRSRSPENEPASARRGISDRSRPETFAQALVRDPTSLARRVHRVGPRDLGVTARAANERSTPPTKLAASRRVAKSKRLKSLVLQLGGGLALCSPSTGGAPMRNTVTAASLLGLAALGLVGCPDRSISEVVPQQG